MAAKMNHPRRQYLQHLRSGDWVLASDLPDKPRLRLALLTLGWINCQGNGRNLRCRITAAGMAAMQAPTPDYTNTNKPINESD